MTVEKRIHNIFRTFLFLPITLSRSDKTVTCLHSSSTYKISNFYNILYYADPERRSCQPVHIGIFYLSTLEFKASVWDKRWWALQKMQSNILIYSMSIVVAGKLQKSKNLLCKNTVLQTTQTTWNGR